MRFISKLITLLLLTIFCPTSLFSQHNEKEIMEQGKLLYKSEKASWQGTDMFLDRFPEKSKLAGGYFSYTEKDRNICVFYDRDTVPKTVAVFSFDDTYLSVRAQIDTVAREFSDYEKDLYSIRKEAMAELNRNPVFEFYNYTSFNPVPLIYKEKKMVYFFTGPKKGNVVIFGNDYLITFNDDNTVDNVEKLHSSMTPVNYSGNSSETNSLHAHTEDDIITATDVCVLMLYSPYTNWEKHYVLSKTKVSVWDCFKNEFYIIDRSAWEKGLNAAKQKKE